MTAPSGVRELVDGRDTLQARLIYPRWTDENGDEWCWIGDGALRGEASEVWSPDGFSVDGIDYYHYASTVHARAMIGYQSGDTDCIRSSHHSCPDGRGPVPLEDGEICDRCWLERESVHGVKRGCLGD